MMAFYKIVIALYFIKVIELAIIIAQIGIVKTGSIIEGIVLWIFTILFAYFIYVMIRLTTLTVRESWQRKTQCYVNRRIKEV